MYNIKYNEHVHTAIQLQKLMKTKICVIVTKLFFHVFINDVQRDLVNSGLCAVRKDENTFFSEEFRNQ